jgi:hypothetical protein
MICLQPPPIGNFSPANAPVGTSGDDQAALAAPMVGMVGVTCPCRIILFIILPCMHLNAKGSIYTFNDLMFSFCFEFLQNSDSRSLVDVKPKIQDESVEKSRIWKLTEINEPSQCRSLRLPDSLTSMRVWFTFCKFY